VNNLIAITICAAALFGCAAPPPIREHIIAPTKVRVDPAHRTKMPAEYYSDESRRNHEQGTCIVKLIIGVDGKVRDATLTQSTGYKRLDDACVDFLSTIQMLPATENGKPIVSSVDIPIAFKLNIPGP
jgi:TonB family protein